MFIVCTVLYLTKRRRLRYKNSNRFFFYILFPQRFNAFQSQLILNTIYVFTHTTTTFTFFITETLKHLNRYMSNVI